MFYSRFSLSNHNISIIGSVSLQNCRVNCFGFIESSEFLNSFVGWIDYCKTVFRNENSNIFIDCNFSNYYCFILTNFLFYSLLQNILSILVKKYNFSIRKYRNQSIINNFQIKSIVQFVYILKFVYHKLFQYQFIPISIILNLMFKFLLNFISLMIWSFDYITHILNFHTGFLMFYFQ